MTHHFRFALRFYFPLALSITVLFLLFVDSSVLVDISKILADVEVQLGPIRFRLPSQTLAKQDLLLRGAIVLSSLMCALWALSVDFSRYLPSKLRMEAFFRIDHIEQTIRKYFSDEQKNRLFELSWSDLLKTYDDEVWNSLVTICNRHSLPGVLALSEFTRNDISANGGLNFKVEKVGLLTYKVSECAGRLKCKVEIPHRNPFKFHEDFVLQDSPANEICPSIRELLRWPPSVLLALEFKQIFTIVDCGIETPFDHIIVAMTRVTLLPFPTFARSLYLWQTGDGRRIPIGFTRYYRLTNDLGSKE